MTLSTLNSWAQENHISDNAEIRIAMNTATNGDMVIGEHSVDHWIYNAERDAILVVPNDNQYADEVQSKNEDGLNP